jgi:hypothetical protein
MVKICSLCEIEKSLDEFHKHKHSKDGYRSRCKECRKSDTKKYYENNSEKIKKRINEYRKHNKGYIETNRKYQEKNREFILKLKREWSKSENGKKCKQEYYQKNKEKIKEYVKNYRIINKEKYEKYINERRKSDKYKEWKNEYTKKHKEKNPHIYAWRTMLHNTLKRFGTSKEDTTINLLGYSAEQLKLRLECQFKDGICWENYGEWHIDHKKPVSAFPPDTDMSIVNALSNLQPLWAYDNLSKGNSTK